MKKIIICNYYSINGCVIDSFEYFYNSWTKDKTIELWFININPLTEIFLKERYNLDISCFNNIKVVSLEQILKTKFDKILCVNEHTVRSLKPYKLKCKEIHNIVSSPDRFIFNKEYTYVEYPDLFGPGEFYHPKIDCELIIKPRFHKNKTFVNCMAPNIEAYKIMSRYNFFKKHPGLNIGNLFEEFNRFLYIKTPLSFDRKPRLFYECRYFDIDVEYYNLSSSKDGSTYRYNDTSTNRSFKEDIVIERFLN